MPSREKEESTAVNSWRYDILDILIGLEKLSWI
jgi:hypothetical protein